MLCSSQELKECEDAMGAEGWKIEINEVKEYVEQMIFSRI